MSIELTAEQARAVAAEGEAVVVVDPQTHLSYRLVREDLFLKLQAISWDDTGWTPGETALLAGAAFAKLDDDDYSHYLRGNP